VIKSHAIIDCGTTGYAFIDEDYVHYHYLPLHLLKLPGNLTVIDGRPVTSGIITNITCKHPVISNHQEDISLFVPKLA
jgi:hypothetical protein